MAIRGSGKWFQNDKGGPAAPIETFARLQAGSQAFEDFQGMS